MLGTYFFDVITNHYLDFSGRATRTQFWLFVLFAWIVGMILGILATNIGGFIGNIFAFLTGIYGLFLFLPALSITARRVRDAGFSPWFLLLLILVPVGELIILVMCVLPSK